MSEGIFLSMKKFNLAKEYWFEKLAGEPEAVRLIPDFGVTTEYRAAVEEARFPAEPAADLLRMSKSNDLSLYVILLTCLKILLFKVTGQADIVVVSPILSQHSSEYNRFVLLRDYLAEGMSFRDLLMQVKDTAAGAYQHDYYPVNKLFELLNVGAGSTFFKVVLVLENIQPGGSLAEILEDFGNEITLSFNRREGGLTGEIIYNSQLYEGETVRRLWGFYTRIAAQVARSAEVKIGEIEVIGEGERRKILYDFNRGRPEPDTAAAAPVCRQMFRGVSGLFEEQAARLPDQTMLVCPDGEAVTNWRITYGLLNGRTNQLARFLMARGIGAGSVVAILLNDTVQQAEAIIGVLKAGAAYLPLDPDNPGGRIEYILRDSSPRAVLSRMAAGEKDVFYVDDDGIRSQEESNPEAKYSASDPAYIIYTSGTTGRPKGVVVEQGSMADKIVFRRQNYRMDTQAVALQLFSFAFDGFVTSFFTPVVSGSQVVLLSQNEVLDINRIRDTVVRNGVTHFISVPSLYRLIVDNLTPHQAASLKVVTLAGERTAPDIIALTRSKSEAVEIAHEYGVTEASVVSTIYRHQERDSRVKIGSPVAGTTIYILDDRDRAVPIGIFGELCISGSGLARGYLNRPELTAQRFIPHPLTRGESVYRSGDLGRWLADGNIELLGRKDNQVKIRGNRIELEEIEKQLLRHEQVEEAAAVVRDDEEGEKYICVYFTGWQRLTVAELKSFLATQLPYYMIPSFFVQLEALPRTVSGKLERKSLPEPRRSLMNLGSDYVAPQSEMEKKMAEIWSEVLHQEKVGIYDNFFDLGGNSLNVVQIGKRLEMLLEKRISVVKLFEYPCISALYQYLCQDGEEESRSRRAGSGVLNRAEQSFQEAVEFFEEI